MEPKNNQEPRIVWVTLNAPPGFNWEIDPMMKELLQRVISDMQSEHIDLSKTNEDESDFNFSDYEDIWDLDGMGCPDEMAELDAIDAMVTGEDHPDTYKMIMDAYHKIQTK